MGCVPSLWPRAASGRLLSRPITAAAPRSHARDVRRTVYHQFLMHLGCNGVWDLTPLVSPLFPRATTVFTLVTTLYTLRQLWEAPFTEA